MEIKIESKFNIGDIKKIKGSYNQKLIICEIITVSCKAGTQIFYKGVLFIKKDNYGLTAKSWQAAGGIEQELPEEWTLDKGLDRVDEMLLGD